MSIFTHNRCVGRVRWCLADKLSAVFTLVLPQSVAANEWTNTVIRTKSTREQICFAGAALDEIDLIDRKARVHVAEFQRDKFWILTNIGGIIFECQAWLTSVVDISLDRAFHAWVQSQHLRSDAFGTPGSREAIQGSSVCVR